jgi:GAF domain-containing protein
MSHAMSGSAPDQPPRPESVVGQLTEVLLSTDDARALLEDVVHLAADTIGPEMWCGITLEVPEGPVTVALSHEEATRLDHVQYDHGDGPCLHSLRHRELVLLEDTEQERRWAEYCAAATVLGVRSSLSVPLHSTGHAPGALNLYAERPGAFGHKEIGRAEAFGAEASRALDLAGRLNSAVELAHQLRRALVSRTTIDQAIGVVMGQNRCDADTAFDMLRSASQHRNVKLRDIAAGVLRSVGSEPRPPAD